MITRQTFYRLGLALGVLTVLFLLFGLTALGVIGDGGPEDRLHLGVFVVLVVGVALARLRAPGMGVALAATAVAQMIVGVVAIALGYHETDGASALEILALTGMYAGLFAASAVLFWRAAAAPEGEPAVS